MTYIKVSVDRDHEEISVENNGKSIPILMHAASITLPSTEKYFP